MDIQKTREYYGNLSGKDICDCIYCQNYVKKVKQAYPELAERLFSIGADIEKPLETIPLDPDGKTIDYIAVYYAVMGKPEGFENFTVSGVKVETVNLHPPVNTDEEHFVIGISPIVLGWEMRRIYVKRKFAFRSARSTCFVIVSNESRESFMKKLDLSDEIRTVDKKGRTVPTVDNSPILEKGVRLENGKSVELNIPNDAVSLFVSTFGGKLSNEIPLKEFRGGSLTVTAKRGLFTIDYPVPEKSDAENNKHGYSWMK